MESQTQAGYSEDNSCSGEVPASKGGLNRREFLSAAGVLAGGTLLSRPLSAEQRETPAPSSWAMEVPLELVVNGEKHQLRLDPRVTLLDLLREHLHLTGTKKGCDHGQCGGCTVLANGRRINSCLSLAVTHAGEAITTVEGLAPTGGLHPVQSAFIEHDGFQCGYCTSGQICSTVALVTELQRGEVSFVTPNLSELGEIKLTDDEIRERLSGNICRCGAYPGIVAAARVVCQNARAGSNSKPILP
ncbi:MAG: 2Fe-2S iron-sulfur cluster-binding protein [Verrucomicrobiota bacterium]